MNGWAKLDVGRKTKNKILASLTKSDAALLAPMLSPVDLPARKVLETRGRAIEHAYFLDCGLASIVANGGPSHSIEIGIVGREGLTGISVLLGAGLSPHETFMQSAGTGRRIAAGDLLAAMEKSPTLRARLLKFCHTLMVQMGFTALANGRYKLEERLARWLLMAQDRSDGDDIFLTHEFLALMLGTRRPGITTSLNLLEKARVIRSVRGIVTVKNRSALEEAANGSYGAAEAEYLRLLGA